MPETPAVDIVPAKTTTHIKSAGMVDLRQATPPEPPAAPLAKPASAPPVPLPITPSAPDPVAPAPRKAMTEALTALRNRNAPKAPLAPPPEKPAEKAGDEPPPETAGDEPPPEGAKPGDKPAKPSPWKLVEDYKSRLLAAEQQLLETKKLIPDEAGAKLQQERYEALKKQNEELLEEIRYQAYQKHPDFQEKYDKPYFNSIKRALTQLNGVMVENEEGQSRALNANDLIKIVNAGTLREAKELAEENFGDYAEDVLQQTARIKEAWEARVEALEQARAGAGEWEQKRNQAQAAETKALREQATEVYRRHHDAAMADPENSEFFKPVEGDDARNEVLRKGYELVDTAATENPLDPKLTPEQRESAIKKHVAVRQRAAGYGVLKHELKKIRAEAAELREKLKQYEATVPDTRGGTAPAAGAPSLPRKASAEVFEALRALARPR